jgi:hypothetical protein
LLVINPRYDPRCAAKVLASARQVKERFGGGRFRCLSPHSICIHIYKGLVVNLLACTKARLPPVGCGKSTTAKGETISDLWTYNHADGQRRAFRMAGPNKVWP